MPDISIDCKRDMIDHISVCICTYRRNSMLERLLRNLALQRTKGLFDYSVVVVDNDAAGPARDTVLGLGKELAMDIVYGIEPERTIPAARNQALRLARGNFIGIIDDDEYPPSDWLLTLYGAIRTYDADGVLGPVHPSFEGKPPSWLLKGRFCERPVHRTGTLLHWSETRTGNVLLRREVFDRYKLSFDTSFRTGGSDREFFKVAMRVGCRFIAVEEAPVYELVPPERWTKTYYLRRALVNGFNAHRNSAGDVHGLRRLMLPLKSACAVLVYGVATPFSAILGGHVLVSCLERGGHHLSRLFAMMGIELVKRRNF
jgi:succinoglycan biosynthesis protein ExoM